MKDKYYTPEIEEFHPGFKYEVKDLHDNLVDYVWKEETMGIGCDFVLNELLSGDIRVKHLDREDVLSCNWEHKFNGFSEDGKTTFDKFQRGDMFLLHEDDGHVVIWMENLSSVTFFRGIIKNKSELKKVLKMLGI